MTTLLALLVYGVFAALLGLILGRIIHFGNPSSKCDCDLCTKPRKPTLSGTFDEDGVRFDDHALPTYNCTSCDRSVPFYYLREDGRCMDCHFPTKQTANPKEFGHVCADCGATVTKVYGPDGICSNCV